MLPYHLYGTRPDQTIWYETSGSSWFTANAYLSTPKKLQKLAILAVIQKDSRREINTLTARIEAMCQKAGILVDSELHQDLVAIVGESQQTLPNSFGGTAGQNRAEQRPPTKKSPIEVFNFLFLSLPPGWKWVTVQTFFQESQNVHKSSAIIVALRRHLGKIVTKKTRDLYDPSTTSGPRCQSRSFVCLCFLLYHPSYSNMCRCTFWCVHVSQVFWWGWLQYIL